MADDDKRSTFTNHSKRLWNEEECRAMLNAALLYLAMKAGGRIEIPTEELMAVCTSQKNPGVAMALSDDDKILMIAPMPDLPK